MSRRPLGIGLAGAGSMAQMHLYAIDALRHYYGADRKVAARAILNRGSRAARLAESEGIELLDSDDFWQGGLDGVVITSPNACHLENFSSAIEAGIPHIYVEKPLCCGDAELTEARRLAGIAADKGIRVHCGFQFLQAGAFQKGWEILNDGAIGDPIHFSGEYLHQGYLDSKYREARVWRLKERPEGGTIVDLGTHVVSGLVALLGSDLDVLGASASSVFEDVPAGCDLDCLATLRQERTGALGTLHASRVAAGCGDLLRYRIFGTQGSLRISTEDPDTVILSDRRGEVRRIPATREYQNSDFPHGNVPAGWLRSLVHAHARFWGLADGIGPVADLDHALSVQGIINRIISLMDGET